jgi:hypothetical protein
VIGMKIFYADKLGLPDAINRKAGLVATVRRTKHFGSRCAETLDVLYEQPSGRPRVKPCKCNYCAMKYAPRSYENEPGSP